MKYQWFISLSYLSIPEAIKKGQNEALCGGKQMCCVRPEGKLKRGLFQGSIKHVQ